MRLINSAGQIIKQEIIQADAHHVLQLNVSRLTRGVYLLNVQLENGTQLNKKVVKF